MSSSELVKMRTRGILAFLTAHPTYQLNSREWLVFLTVAMEEGLTTPELVEQSQMPQQTLSRKIRSLGQTVDDAHPCGFAFGLVIDHRMHHRIRSHGQVARLQRPRNGGGVGTEVAIGKETRDFKGKTYLMEELRALLIYFIAILLLIKSRFLEMKMKIIQSNTILIINSILTKKVII